MLIPAELVCQQFYRRRRCPALYSAGHISSKFADEPDARSVVSFHGPLPYRRMPYTRRAPGVMCTNITQLVDVILVLIL